MFFQNLLASAEAAVSAVAMEEEKEFSIAEFCDKIWTWIKINQEYLLKFAICVIVAIPVAIIISWILQGIIRLIIKKSNRDDKKIASSINKPIVFAGILSGIVFGLRYFNVPEGAMCRIKSIYFVVIVLVIAWALLRMISVMRYLLQAVAAKTENVYDDLLVSLVYPVLKCIIWVVAILFIAENAFNFQITTLLAGAGIVAMAIAFAAQNTIANIFGALALISDRPFGIGDMISFNGKRGSVVSIGLRSTTLRTLDGTIWSVPNKEVAEASIENISKRPNIKWAFNVDLVYGTTPEQMMRAKEIVKEVLLASKFTDAEVNAPAVWFAEMAESSLRITAANWFQTKDWGAFCAERETIQLELLKRFAAENLELAFNTQTVHIVNDN